MGWCMYYNGETLPAPASLRCKQLVSVVKIINVLELLFKPEVCQSLSRGSFAMRSLSGSLLNGNCSLCLYWKSGGCIPRISKFLSERIEG